MGRRLALSQVENGTEAHDDVHGDDDPPQKPFLPLGRDSLEERYGETGLAERAADNGHELADVNKFEGRRYVGGWDICNVLPNAEGNGRRDACRVGCKKYLGIRQTLSQE